MPEKTIQSLYQGMEKVHNILEEKKIPYFIICGTLLGSVRNGKFIPWDDDIDIGIFEEDIDRFNSIDFGYRTIPTSGKGCGKIFTENNGFIDVFPFRKVGNKYQYLEHAARYKWPNEFFLEEELLPLKKYDFGKCKLNGPNNAIPYCRRSWGKNWKTPSMKFNKMLYYPIEAIQISFIKYRI